MESVEAYLERKSEELNLLNGCLAKPLSLPTPGGVADVITTKFKIAAALKAEHILEDWAVTETAWAHTGRVRAGPFEFRYDYQRADLQVRGPAVYRLGRLRECSHTLYTASGMAAISALLSATARVLGEADLLALPGSYSETLEVVESHMRHLRLVKLNRLEDAGASASARVLLFDSCIPAEAYRETIASRPPPLDLIIFDTTCFAASSGRIRKVLNWAKCWKVPTVLVRSHTKLDSLGVEYGRLGSAVFGQDNGESQPPLTKALIHETSNAIRLFGGAALPAHFPPFVDAPSYQRLTNQRIAAIIRNTRRAARYLATALSRSAAELHFAHGLYLTLSSDRITTEKDAREAAEQLSCHVQNAGLPFRHAGSFAFDFGAAEWLHHGASDRYAVRIAVPDLPTKVWDEIVAAVRSWWSRNLASGAPTSTMTESPAAAS